MPNIRRARVTETVGEMVLELDGKHHEDQADYDARRDEFIASHGMGNILVVRIPNYAVTDPLFLNQLREFLTRRKADVSLWLHEQSSTIAAQRRAWESQRQKAPVAAERHACVCAECGASFRPAGSGKDLRGGGDLSSNGRRRQ